MAEFKDMLLQFREHNELTAKALAEKLGCTESFINHLEKGRKKPSREKLRLLFNFVKDRSGILAATDLLFSSIGLENTLRDSLAQFLGGKEDEINRESRLNFETAVIITDVIGETVNEQLFEITRREIESHTSTEPKYYYLIPDGSQGDSQWRMFKDTMFNALGHISKNLRNCVRCIQCSNPFLFFPRMRIFDPGNPRASGAFSIGPIKKPLLYELDQSMVNDIWKHLSPILHRLDLNIRRNEVHPVEDPNLGRFILKFPEVEGV